MEEIAELRAKAIASMAASGNPNSKLKRKSPASREEGELSDEEEGHQQTHFIDKEELSIHLSPTTSRAAASGEVAL